MQGTTHQGDGSALDRDVRAGADSEADIGCRQRRRIIDAIADHGHGMPLAAHFADYFGLVLGQDLRPVIINAGLGGDGASGGFHVAGHHHDLDAGFV